jgi:mono/diheme cytochrome c family protein
MTRRSLRWSLPLAAIAMLIVIGSACDKKATSSTTTPPSSTTPAGEASNDPPGLALFKNTGCTNCHSTPQTGPAKGKRPGPDLAKVAADETHTREWLMNYVRDPHGQNPQAKMPAFGSKLGEDNLGKVADFLLTLK